MKIKEKIFLSTYFIFFALISDQTTKIIVQKSNILTKYTVFSFLDLRPIWNKGISYGLFQAHSSLRVWFIIFFEVLITMVLFIWIVREKNSLKIIPISLIIGGSLGNIIDRVQHGSVYDFISLHAFSFNWYIFNLADFWIVLGTFSLIFVTIFNAKKN